MDSNDLALGIDLGGSKIYAVVTDAANSVLATAKTQTESNSTPEKIAQAMIDTGKLALAEMNLTLADVKHIGAALPSPVDPVTGDAHFATNLGLKNFSMKAIFKKLTGKEVYLGNDGDLGTLSEYHSGAAKSCHTVVGYFIGTGLGGGLVVEDKLLKGNCGLAAELGHMIIKKGGRRCGCGHKGCIEAYCSKIAYVKAIKKEIRKRALATLLPTDKFNLKSTNIKSKYLARAYAAGDPVVRNVIDKGSVMLGIAAASTCAVVAPECIVLGGGVVASMGDAILPVFRKSFESHLFGIPPSKIKIRLSAYGDNAVAVGATILARRKGNV